jgi:hypothetical protein
MSTEALSAEAYTPRNLSNMKTIVGSSERRPLLLPSQEQNCRSRRLPKCYFMKKPLPGCESEGCYLNSSLIPDNLPQCCSMNQCINLESTPILSVNGLWLIPTSLHCSLQSPPYRCAGHQTPTKIASHPCFCSITGLPL